MTPNYPEIAQKLLQDIKTSIRFDGNDDYSDVEVSTNRAGKVVIDLTVGAIDRGPRTDHGGGDDGDDWMDDHVLEDYTQEYHNKNKPVIEKIKKIISSHFGSDFTIKDQFDYGEKGHITVYFTISQS